MQGTENVGGGNGGEEGGGGGEEGGGGNRCSGDEAMQGTENVGGGNRDGGGEGGGGGEEGGGGGLVLTAAAAPPGRRGRRRRRGAAAAVRTQDIIQVSHCGLCGIECDIEARSCPNCKSLICPTCASISVGLLDAVKPFLKGQLPCAAWVGLFCLSCQSVQDFDCCLSECLRDVLSATSVSMNRRKIDFECERLWYHVGLLFAVGGPFSGFFFDDNFRECVEKMVNHEAKKSKALVSIAPWEAEVLALDSKTILSVARNYAARFKLEPFGTREPFGARNGTDLNKTDDERFRILYVSPDLGDHPTAHLMAGELLEMATSELAHVVLLCVATPDRLEALNVSSSRYRKELERVFGKDLLKVGHLEDQEITQHINDFCPQVIYLAGFHQDGDRIGIFEGLAGGPLIVQAVAHASTTGSKAVHYLLCNQEVLPKTMQKYFTERFLYVDAPFLPNSMMQFFGHLLDELSQLRNDLLKRSVERESRRMPGEAKIIVNIAKPDRLEKRFFEMAIAILVSNPDALLFLVDHGYPAFRQRIQAHFKQQGLQGRVVFMPFQALETGELHRFLALCDLYLDTLAYNSHTAGHDAIFANGVFITVEGTRLSSRVGADLLRHFGCPENICADPAAAVARVNQLLQNPELLANARMKADRCRAASEMYNNKRRSEIVIAALIRAFEEAVEQRKQKQVCSASASQQLVGGASASQELSDSDLGFVCGVMEELGIVMQGESEIKGRFLIIRAQFREVSVVVKITSELDAAFRELLARDGKLSEFGMQLFPQLLPFDENWVSGADTELDVLQIPCNGKTLFAVIEEVHAHRAAAMFDALSLEWRAKPAEDTVVRTSCLIIALVKALKCLHERGKAYGGDPRECKLSLLKDGYGKEAPAYVQHLGEVYSLLLGGADHLIDPLVPCTFLTQELSNEAPQRRRAGSNRSIAVLDRSRKAAAVSVRVSTRKIGSSASLSFSHVRGMLVNQVRETGSHFSIAKAQSDDLRKAALAVLNAILGKTVQETVVAGKGACDLFRIWLGTLSDHEFQNMTGIRSRDHVNDDLCRHSMKTVSQLEALFELLALLVRRDELLQAQEVLASNPFPGMAVPSNAYPGGLESAPEAERNDLQSCTKLMKQIGERVLHIYVPGRILDWNHEPKKLIPVWLVYKWEEDKKKFYRSLFTAAEGERDEFGALYHSPIETDAVRMGHRSKVHFLAFPTCKTVMDGRPRAFDDTAKSVAAGEVAQYANSCLNESGGHYRVANCAREWNQNWTTLDTSRSSGRIADAIMGLKLVSKVEKYKELLYPYNWGKYDADHLRQLTSTKS